MAEHANDRCPSMVGSERMVDPFNETGLWVTVEFPESMKHTHSDEQLMKFVVQQIQRGRAIISTYAKHYERHLCLSLPVVGFAGEEEPIDVVMDQAETVALWWLEQILAYKVRLDCNVLFP
ncbi:uncharacterized protein N7479_006752 [Penicillium vulpinum]|uniref:Uncharacterized protein n=1 Tax=Penicillium vulpinum TaxID=29845 RepID=A0A1V6RW00_9EURO|nr:uncharacterized protein N7479_006752 [Penicillium vulpinum]KAJ5959602.1 hypothetical protein N7479_006752 [Penicillium vulpinum]OQE05700.1 hypothetical protein PENVUL_c022G00766 [Penicillium vulpinum]